MSSLLIVNVISWSAEQVAHWLEGLDDILQNYVGNFIENEITGKKLLVLDHQDLDNLDIRTLGHQELVLEAVDLLCQLQYTLENETIQSMALKLSCQARCVHNDIEQYEKLTTNSDRLPVIALSGIAKAVGHIKNLVSWLDRAPFDGSDEYIKKRNTLVKIGTDLINDVQGDSVFDNNLDLKSNCLTVAELCENIIQNSKDTLTIQPAWLEMAIIRKKPEEELGMHIQSSYNGTHTIGGIKDESPAHLCRKIEEGDEVIMVNGQMVIGWQLKKLVNTLKENKKEISLTLKKRPCHADPFGHKGHKKKRGNKLQPGTFPMKGMRSRKSRKSGKTRVPLQLINTTPEAVTETFTDSVKEVESENDALDDNDNVFRSGSESPGFQNLRTFDDKVKHRRATVSGGSPTLKRPSIMVSDSDSAPRPKSYALALSSPGSEDFSSLELSSFDLGSPASERTSPPVDSDTGSSRLASSSSGKIVNKVVKTPVRSTMSSPVKSLSSPAPGINKSKDALDHTSVKSENISQLPLIVKSDMCSPNSSSGQIRIAENPSIVMNEEIVNTDVKSTEPTKSNANQSSKASISSESSKTPQQQQQSNKNNIPSPQSNNNNNNISLALSTARDSSSSTASSTQFQTNSSVSKVTAAVSKYSRQSPSPTKSNASSTDSSSSGSYKNSTASGGGIGAYPKSTNNLAQRSDSPKGMRWNTNSTSTGGMDSPKNIARSGTPGSDSPRWKRSNEQAAKVIAGAVEELNSPTTLISIKRIDSKYRADLADQERRERQKGELSSPESLSGRATPQEDDRPLSIAASYTVNIVGGIPHVVKSPPISMAQDQATPKSPSTAILRDKGGNKHKQTIRNRLVGANRRISCKDLGHGDCQGWLYKKKESHSIGSNFVKRWCVLKENNLYYYKTPDDQKAHGVVHLPGFQVSPANEFKTKKFAFKAHHSGTTFYFASDRQEDRAKWMNKMGLAAIAYDAKNDPTTASFISPRDLSTVIENGSGYYSESDDDESIAPSLPSTPKLLAKKSSKEDLTASALSIDDLEKLATNITRNNMSLEGQDRNEKRRRRLTSNNELLNIDNVEEVEKKKKLKSLERTLKAKEIELEAIQSLLENTTVNTDTIQSFKAEHPHLFSSHHAEAAAYPSSTSCTSEDEI